MLKILELERVLINVDDRVKPRINRLIEYSRRHSKRTCSDTSFVFTHPELDPVDYFANIYNIAQFEFGWVASRLNAVDSNDDFIKLEANPLIRRLNNKVVNRAWLVMRIDLGGNDSEGHVVGMVKHDEKWWVWDAARICRQLVPVETKEIVETLIPRTIDKRLMYFLFE